jgi:(p)ppGpp synthase/HD superfamily hydrolase
LTRFKFETSYYDAIDFVNDFKLNLYSSEIFVFTPMGDLKSLPTNATPVDFAFSKAKLSYLFKHLASQEFTGFNN